MREKEIASDSENIADKAEKIIFGDREKTYGDPGKNLSIIAGMWSAYLGVEITPHHVCDMMIQLKLVRLKNNPDHEDSKVDVIGYALLKERLQEPVQNDDALVVKRLMPMRECKQDRTVLVDTDFSEDLTEAAVDTANQVIITSSGHEIKFSDCTGWIPVPRYEPGD